MYQRTGTEHPRPQLRREQWQSLDGSWEFADDVDGRWNHPSEVSFGEHITVPFAPETPASGVGRAGYRQACWYRRTLQHQQLGSGEQLHLHFGAVDYSATVWVDGYPIGQHTGGYTGFAVDVTTFADDQQHQLVVRAQDDPLDLAKPRGKQDWNLEPHSVWYPRTTGIWQGVWLERLPPIFVAALQWYGDLDNYAVRMDVRLRGDPATPTRLRVKLTCGDRELVDDVINCGAQRMERTFQLDGRGLDMLRDELTWSPEHPALIDAELQIMDGAGQVIDQVYSYTAMRTVAVRAGRFLLNGRPHPLRMVLDQGYWPDSGLTAPTPAALQRDVELAKAMGFNGVRKHQKIEDPRYLAAADRLGLLVWAELPPAYRFDNDAIQRSTTQWTDAIERDRSHPCIVGWIPFNESCGVLNLPTHGEQRHYLQSVALLTSALDPSRLVITNDGWEGIGGDVIGIHDYDDNPASLARRYAPEHLAATLTNYAANGRLPLLDDPAQPVTHLGSDGPRAIMLTEFGGIGYATGAPLQHGAMQPDAPADRLNMPPAWGYSTVTDPHTLITAYRALIDAAQSVAVFTGFCYTQFTDTYQEVNGLLFADRTPKAPLEQIRAATLSIPSPHEQPEPSQGRTGL